VAEDYCSMRRRVKKQKCPGSETGLPRACVVTLLSCFPDGDASGPSFALAALEGGLYVLWGTDQVLRVS